MVDATLSGHLDDERAQAVKAMLRYPMLDVDAEPEVFRLVARHQAWLAEWFEAVCGWALVVDAGAGFARLGKRAAAVDERRPLRRTRASRAPFDRRRYQLLCLVCAELVRHPVTTLGLLAGAITADAALDSGRHGERAAFVDALHVLMSWGALETVAGDVDAFLDSAHGNAILTADTARLHRLIVSSTAPSSLPDNLDGDAATEALLAEPRYGQAGSRPDAADDDQRLRWTRHSLGRRAVDDPVTYFADLSDTERSYLATSGGRKWLRDRVAEAGFELEERSDGFLAVDPDALATDVSFPAPQGNVHQLALLLVDRLIVDNGEERTLTSLSPTELRRAVAAVLDSFPGWAKAHRDGDGPERLARGAVDLLVDFGLVDEESDGTVVARPALARYRVGEPQVRSGELSLFEEV
jgi:uncharacterized protein (TIGR02678 family)